MRDTSFAVLPIRDHAFFEQAVLERGFCQCLLELARLGSQRLDLVRSGLARGIASEPLLAGLQKLLGPAILEVLGDAVLAAQPVQDDADLLLGGELPPGGASDVPDGLLRALRSMLVSLSHRVPPRGYDELDSLPYTITSICPLGPDGEHTAPSGPDG